MAVTKLSNLVDPQVIADFVDQKLIDAIKFAPLCIVKDDLVGKPGDKLSFPKWAYVGDADTVEEGASIGANNLTNSMVEVQVHKIAKGIGFTDEAQLSGLGNVAEEAATQILLALAAAEESEIYTQMATATLTYAYDDAKNAPQNVALALEKFGEDMDGAKVLVIAPDLYAKIFAEIVPNTDLGAEKLISGSIGQIMGCEVVVSNRLKGKNAAYIVKPGALALVNKRGVMVEFDRDPDTQTDYVYGSKIYAPYLYDASKIIKITLV